MIGLGDDARNTMNVNNPKAGDQTDGVPKVSVILPSYNSAPHIRQCLATIRAQTTKLPFEVILVDSSHDGTDQIVAEEFPEVRLFHFQERCYVGKARNIGVDQARGEIVLFLDTDCIPDPTWIDDMYHGIQNHEADGVGGAVENGTPGNITGSVGFYLEFFRFLAYKGTPNHTPFFMGGNSGFRRDVCRSLRFNDWRLGGEDFIFTWQLAQRGKTLLFLPSVVVRHMNKTGVRKVLRYQFWLGSGACLYRQTVSPTFKSFLEYVPIAIFLSPPFIMLWISALVLRRRGILEWLKFLRLVPFLFLAHCVWASGFFRELLNQKYARQQVEENGRVAVMPTPER